VIDHPEFGWLAFGGNVKTDGKWIQVQSLDSFRRRIYIAPLGLWLTLDAGTFDGVQLNPASHVVRLGLSAATPYVNQARLRISQAAKLPGVGTYRPVQPLTTARDAFEVPLKTGGITWVELND
jgi:hypothetical protein